MGSDYDVSTRPVVPELGPLLGRLSTPAWRGPQALPLDDVRRKLLATLYDHAGSARRDLAAGRGEAARARLNHAAWLAAWKEALQTTSARVLAEIDRRFDAAAAESRMPARLLARAKPDADDRRTVGARLSAAGIPLERAADPALGEDWSEGLLRIAMALDSSWDRLEQVVADELESWQAEVARVRAWRRPTGPLWALTAITLLIAVLLGLSIGGYLPAPGPLGWIQQWFWSIPWR
jgi:hypothetical protein